LVFCALAHELSAGHNIYVLTKDSRAAVHLSKGSTRVTIISTLACVLAVAAGLTWLATHATQYLPALYLNAVEQTPFGANINLFLWAMNITAFVLLFARRHTILDLWLFVVLFAWWPNFLVAVALARFVELGRHSFEPIHTCCARRSDTG